MVNYEPLWETMKLKKVTTYALIHKYKIIEIYYCKRGDGRGKL